MSCDCMRSPGTDSGRAKCGQSGALEVRCSEHSVFGSLLCIIVFVEVRLPSGSWACVPAREDALTVMPGTLIEYLTAGQAQDVLKACQSDAGWFSEQNGRCLFGRTMSRGHASCLESAARPGSRFSTAFRHFRDSATCSAHLCDVTATCSMTSLYHSLDRSSTRGIG